MKNHNKKTWLGYYNSLSMIKDNVLAKLIHVEWDDPFWISSYNFLFQLNNFPSPHSPKIIKSASAARCINKYG